MERNRKLAHIVAYYLSRFDKSALLSLGYKTDKQTFMETARALDLLPNYIKFRRDEFDVAHPHRKGWHKRPMTLSIINTINALQDLDEPTLRTIVLDILLKGKDSDVSEDLDQLILIFPEEKKKKGKRIYIPRSITGKKAEEIFMQWFKKNPEAFDLGKGLIDMRDYGCGYDFQLMVSEKQIYAIEVKGISGNYGGIVLTGKEWETAERLKTDYFLVLVSNIDGNACINIINNPFQVLTPKRSIQTVIQLSWSVDPREIGKWIKA